jgi:uncharacterized membrane protein YadS
MVRTGYVKGLKVLLAGYVGVCGARAVATSNPFVDLQLLVTPACNTTLYRQMEK